MHRLERRPMSRALRIFAAALALTLAPCALSFDAAAQSRGGAAVRTDSIAGTTWRGAFDSENDYTVSYRFNADATAEWSDNGQTQWTGRDEHSWTQDGASVTWRHRDGTVWQATIHPPGNRMTGVIYGSDGEPRGVFRLTRQ